MHAGGTVIMRQATFRDTMMGIAGLLEDLVTTLVTTKGQHGVKRTNNRQQDMLQAL